MPVIQACNEKGLSVQMRFTPRKTDRDPHGKITLSHGETVIYTNDAFARNPYSANVQRRVDEIKTKLDTFIAGLPTASADAAPAAEEEEVAAEPAPETA
jgi:hypothetical protein